MIDVDIRTEGQALKLEVADTGWGIPDVDLPLRKAVDAKDNE